MTALGLRAGTLEQATDPSGVWVFADIGFSESKKSCGYLETDAMTWRSQTAEVVTFAELKRKASSLVSTKGAPLHLVLEAPLSSAFTDAGNPVGRSLEQHPDGRTRYWYVGLGCSVLVAGLHLVDALKRAEAQREVRLFEGFVSFKERGLPSNHQADVKALMDVVRSGGREGQIVEPQPLSRAQGATVTTPLSFLGLGDHIPPVIIAAAP